MAAFEKYEEFNDKDKKTIAAVRRGLDETLFHDWREALVLGEYGGKRITMCVRCQRKYVLREPFGWLGTDFEKSCGVKDRAGRAYCPPLVRARNEEILRSTSNDYEGE